MHTGNGQSCNAHKVKMDPGIGQEASEEKQGNLADYIFDDYRGG